MLPAQLSSRRPGGTPSAIASRSTTAIRAVDQHPTGTPGTLLNLQSRVRARDIASCCG